MSYKYFTVAFLVISFIISVLLWLVIYKHISKKPIISVSVVDLIYRDTIVYILTICFSTSTGIIHTLSDSDENFSLTFEFALLHAVFVNISVNAFCISLIISAGLRLLSLIKNSEATGDAKLSKAYLSYLVYIENWISILYIFAQAKRSLDQGLQAMKNTKNYKIFK